MKITLCGIIALLVHNNLCITTKSGTCSYGQPNKKNVVCVFFYVVEVEFDNFIHFDD